MRDYTAKTVDKYITKAPEEARPKLRELREAVKAAAPKAEEGISWGVPFYKYHGLLAGFSAFTSHVSFGLAFVLESKDREILEEKGYKTGKKTVQIKFDQKVPATEIGKIIKARAKINEVKRAIK